MVTVTGSEPSIWIPKPAQAEAVVEKKKSYVTNYVKGQAPDASLPRIATGGIAPFILGRDIITSPDLMWYGNLKPITETTNQQTTQTDPNTGDETITTTVTVNIIGYTIDVQFCVGLGPGCRLRTISIDASPVWSGTVGPARSTFTVAGSPYIKDVIFNGGNFDQAVDPYLSGVIPQQVPAYRGIAYVIFTAIDVSKLSNLSFEVDRYPDPLALGVKNKIGDDINVASAIAEVITRKWGGAGRDASILGSSFTEVANLLYDEGNGCSLINRNRSSANDVISILLSQIDAAMWEDHETGKIELTAYRKNFDRTSLVRLFDRDITSMQNLTKNSWQSVPTSIAVKYIDRSQNYNEIPILARNLATSDKIVKSGVTLSFPAVRVGTLAAALLAREGASEGSPTQLVQLTTNRKAAKCNPGDIVLITYEDYKFYSVPGIVTKRRTHPVDDNSVTLNVKVILYPNNNVLFAAPEPSFFVPVDPNPHAPTAVKVFSAPWAFKATRPVLNYAAIGTGTKANYNWNVLTDQPMFLGTAYNAAQTSMRMRYHDVPSNTDIIVPSPAGATPDNVTGDPTGIMTGDFPYPVVARLTTAIDKYDNWNGASTTQQVVIKNIGPSDTALLDVLANFTAGNYDAAFIMIDDEIFTLSAGGGATFTFDTALRIATFTGVRRGLGDTVAQSHAVNANVYVFGMRNFETSTIGFPFGVSVNYKATSFAYPKNIRTESPLASAFAVAYTGTNRADRPIRPHNTKINGSRGTSSPTALVLGATPTISWNIRGRDIANSFMPHRDVPWQTDASQQGEILSGRHIVYRVWIKDSANVEWDCGATVDTAEHSNIVATVPLGAAVGVGTLWVDAEFDAGAGLRVSLYKDKLPITLS